MKISRKKTNYLLCFFKMQFADLMVLTMRRTFLGENEILHSPHFSSSFRQLHPHIWQLQGVQKIHLYIKWSWINHCLLLSALPFLFLPIPQHHHGASLYAKEVPDLLTAWAEARHRWAMPGWEWRDPEERWRHQSAAPGTWHPELGGRMPEMPAAFQGEGCRGPSCALPMSCVGCCKSASWVQKAAHRCCRIRDRRTYLFGESSDDFTSASLGYSHTVRNMEVPDIL